MFGKNDTLVDNSYKHASAAPQPVQDTSFGSAGGDFMAAPHAAGQPSFEAVAPQMAEQEYTAPQFDAPQPEAMVAEAPAYQEPHAFAEAPAAEAPAPSSRTTTMSFSEMMAMRSAPQAQPEAPEPAVMDAAMDAAPVEAAAPAPTEAFPVQDTAAEDFAQFAEAPAAETPADAFLAEAPAPTAEPAPQEYAEAPAPAEAEVAETAMDAYEEAVPQQAEMQPEMHDAQLATLQQASQAFAAEELVQTGGKTRLQAAALKVLVDKAQTQDENALAQLNTHGFELLEKLAEGMRPGSDALNAVVESAAALISADLVVPADSRAQQIDALQVIANGVGLQGQVAALQHNQEQEAQGFAQREAEKKAARQEGLPTGQYL